MIAYPNKIQFSIIQELDEDISQHFPFTEVPYFPLLEGCFNPGDRIRPLSQSSHQPVMV
jgi:hypothetical protein